MAMRLLAWKYQNEGMPLPDKQTLQRQAGQIVENAHRIAGERGRNVLSILKELIASYTGKR